MSQQTMVPAAGSLGSTAVPLPGGTPRQLPSQPQSPIRSLRVLIAVLVVVAAIGYLIYNGFQSTTEYYLTIAELKAQGPAATAGEAVRVAGIVQDGSVQRSESSPIVHFTIADGGGSLPVVYQGLVPDIFGPGIQVVVEGHYTSAGIFQASTLLAKCPSKFTAAVPTPVAAP
jgi:cytochrome c-type biogenesis protein CcmE